MAKKANWLLHGRIYYKASLEFRNVVTYCEEEGLALVVGADTNAHHLCWSGKDTHIEVWFYLIVGVVALPINTEIRSADIESLGNTVSDNLRWLPSSTTNNNQHSVPCFTVSESHFWKLNWSLLHTLQCVWTWNIFWSSSSDTYT